MTQIIQFPKRNGQQNMSNVYRNLSWLIAITDKIDTLNFYMGAIEHAEKKGYFLEGEMQKLIEEGRAKRLELAKPDPVIAPVADKPGVYTYTPEMGQERSACQMEASRGYYGKHMYVDTLLELKGRGIKFVKKYKEGDFVTPGHYKVGWNEYCCTNLAYEKLKEKYSISMECLLD